MTINRVSVIACFGFNHNRVNGQNVKSRIIAKALEASTKIKKVDTSGRSNLLKLPFKILASLFSSDNVIIMPAQNGLKVIMPLVALLNVFFGRKIHYVVIGGWLPDMVKNHKWLRFFLKKYDSIYVESVHMKHKLNLVNVEIMPNCKQLNIVETKVGFNIKKHQYRFCTFSRVIKEKGIEDAIKAIELVKKRTNCLDLKLDIYGTIDEEQKEWFNRLLQKYSHVATYKGVVPFSDSSEILSTYYCLLFPTYYEGEGFAGTIIDAYAAGLPIIASDWKYNSEFVKDKVNGLIHKVNDINDLANCIIWAISHPKEWEAFGHRNNEEAKKYMPEKVVEKLVMNINNK